MMKILLVEDQSDKRKKITDFLKEVVNEELIISEAESLRGALKEVVESNDYDYILLDMSMPNFDPSEEYPGDSYAESFAGKEFLEQLKLREIYIPVIVVTQYTSFEGGTVTLESLDKEFIEKYENVYLGSVYFNSAVDDWKNNLLSFLKV